MLSRKLVLAVAATSFFTLIIIMGVLGFSGDIPGLDRDMKYGFIDMNKIVQSGDYFRRTQEEWTRDRRRLLGHYGDQLERLHKRSSLPVNFLAGGLSSKETSKSTSSSGHRHARKTARQNSASREVSNALTTILTRKIRAEQIMDQKRRELNRKGRERVRRAVENVADRNNIDFVYEKVDVVFEREDGALKRILSEEKNLTEEVLRELSSED